MSKTVLANPEKIVSATAISQVVVDLSTDKLYGVFSDETILRLRELFKRWSDTDYVTEACVLLKEKYTDSTVKFQELLEDYKAYIVLLSILNSIFGDTATLGFKFYTMKSKGLFDYRGIKLQDLNGKLFKQYIEELLTKRFEPTAVEFKPCYYPVFSNLIFFEWILEFFNSEVKEGLIYHSKVWRPHLLEEFGGYEAFEEYLNYGERLREKGVKTYNYLSIMNSLTVDGWLNNSSYQEFPKTLSQRRNSPNDGPYGTDLWNIIRTPGFLARPVLKDENIVCYVEPFIFDKLYNNLEEEELSELLWNLYDDQSGVKLSIAQWNEYLNNREEYKEMPYSWWKELV